MFCYKNLLLKSTHPFTNQKYRKFFKYFRDKACNKLSLNRMIHLSKGFGRFGSLNSIPAAQDGNNEDQDLKQMIEQLQNQLGEEKRRIREKEELMEQELQQQINIIIDFKKNWTKEKQKSDNYQSQRRQLTEQEDRSSRTTIVG